MKNILKTGVELKLFDRLEFENYLKTGILKIIGKLEFWKVLENLSLKKINLKIGILKITWKLEFLKNKFEN